MEFLTDIVHITSLYHIQKHSDLTWTIFYNFGMRYCYTVLQMLSVHKRILELERSIIVGKVYVGNIVLVC